MILIRIMLLLALSCGAGAAQAEWREARSRNFIVYSQGSERSLREFSEKLEKFDNVLRLFHNVTAPPSANRLRVFLMGSQTEVARMAGAPGAGVAGYYVTDARGVMMVGIDAGGAGNQRYGIGDRDARLDPQSVLLHEYTHHFMYHYFPATYPTWYSEGFAEFWGATRFLADNVVEVGHPANHRFGSFVQGRWLPIGRLLSAQNYRDVPELDLLYAEGWLLVRYVWDNPERKRQLQTYLGLVNRGIPYADAATQAFGNVGRLNDEIFEYAGRGRFDVLRLPFRQFDIGEIAIRTLDPAEQALLTAEVEMSQGVATTEFPAFAQRVRGLATRFADSAFAQRLLAEVEVTQNNGPAARAAVDRLLTLAPNDPRGLMYRAMLDIRALRAANSADAQAWAGARRLLAQAIRAAPGDPLVREAFYDSYVAQNQLPPEDAQATLYAAVDLAPSDDDLRYKLARDFEQRAMIAEAIAIIRPDAYRLPHRRNESEAERRRREAREDRLRRAGATRRETARDMLARLEGRLRREGGQAVPAN